MMLRGHKSSVKSVQFRPGSQQELVSGAREGSIFLWDARVKSDCCSTRSQGEVSLLLPERGGLTRMSRRGGLSSRSLMRMPNGTTRTSRHLRGGRARMRGTRVPAASLAWSSSTTTSWPQQGTMTGA
eukprot:768737-Hanusia_phi.AAC.5